MPGAVDEGRLARAAAGGDGQAFATLYDRYEGRIYTFCLRLVGNDQDAQDATQDAFLKVLQRLPKLQDRELNFGAYLFTAARNASYDVIGRRKKADAVDEIPEAGSRPVYGEAAPIEVDPERAAMLGSLQEAVRGANARLPERQREVLALRELEELSYDEIAEIMDMNRNSVAQLISRARIKLRDELRGSALASVAVSSKDCERALPLISMRQDGQLRDEDDRAWLTGHLAGCDTCKVSVDAIEEAGVSYRAWTPIVPAAFLFRDTMAKAAELVGADWSDVERPGGPDSPATPDAGAGSGGPGAGAPGGGADGAGDDGRDDDAGAALGSGDAQTRVLAGAVAGAGAAAVSAAAEDEDPRRRRGVLAALLAVVLLLGAGGAVVIGSDDEPARATETVPTVPTTAAPVPTATAPVSTPPATTTRARRGKQATTTPAAPVVVVTGGVTTTVPATVRPPARRPQARRRTPSGGALDRQGGSGTGTPGGSTRPPLQGTAPPPAPTPEPTPPPPAPEPTPTPTPPPTTTTPPTRTTPPTTTTPPSTCDPATGAGCSTAPPRT